MQQLSLLIAREFISSTHNFANRHWRSVNTSQRTTHCLVDTPSLVLKDDTQLISSFWHLLCSLCFELIELELRSLFASLRSLICCCSTTATWAREFRSYVVHYSYHCLTLPLPIDCYCCSTTATWAREFRSYVVHYSCHCLSLPLHTAATANRRHCM